MLGNLFSAAVRVVSLPIKATAIVTDVATGGSGSESSRKELPIIGDVEQLCDDVADELED